LKKFRQVRPENLAVSVMTEAELLYGVTRSASVKINADIVADFLGRLQVMPWTREAAAEYAKLRAVLEKSGNTIGNMDMMIAAHALSLHATLVSNNICHFDRVPKLKLVNWV
jgi:tRNA(fMet)-specific endonuclease VapC